LRIVITRASFVRAPDWPTLFRYTIAVAVAFAAAALRGLLSTVWGDASPFLLFVPAVVLSAWAGGVGPGMVTTLLGALLANFFWLPPVYSLRLASGSELVGLAIFIAIGATICGLSETMYRGRRRLEGLLHSIDEGFVGFDMDWRYRYVNERAAELLRQPASALVGKAIWDVFPDIVGTDIESNLRRASAQSETIEFETLYKPYGRWFRTRVFPTPEGFAALLEDTTARKQAEDASLRLAAIVLWSDEAIVAKDLDGIITAWNPAAERLFGFTAEEAIGRSIRMIVPADRQTEEDEVLRRLRRGEAIDHMETVRVRKDGTPVDIALTVSPIKDAAGRIIGASKIARDITERRRAEAERARLLAAEQTARERAESAEERATLLSESSAALSASLDSATTLRTVSRLVVPRFADWCIIDLVARDHTLERVAVSAGASDTEALLLELQQYAPDWNSSQPAAEVLRTRTTILIPAVTDETLVSTSRDARHLEIMRRLSPCSAIAVPMVTRQRTIGAITLVRTTPGHAYGAVDVALAEELARRAALAVDNATLFSEADQARALAEGANRAKDEFLAVLSHELRTPMNAVYGWARMLQLGQIDSTATPRALDAIVRNAHVQLQLIDDLLDVSRIISGKMRLDIRPVDLPRVLEAALDAVRPAADAKGLRLQSLIDPGAGPLNGDPDRLQQVVWNLLMNAVKFTPRDGRIQLALQRVNSHVEIVVSDTGAGIRSELLPLIFDRFKQGESGTTRNQGGLGIGLALVRHLVELHGGSVSAESPGEGKGSTFRVKLPLVAAVVPGGEERVHPTARQAPPSYRGPSLRGLRVLVVDDDPDALDLVATILRRAEAEARLCTSPPEALDVLRSWKPHVLVSDIEMPGEDGYSLIRKVRELSGSEGGQIPAVALTAYGRPEDRVRTLSAGYSMHVAKPVDPVELGVIVANLAGRSLAG
jgi:PAS domain S-box-containing protein